MRNKKTLKDKTFKDPLNNISLLLVCFFIALLALSLFNISFYFSQKAKTSSGVGLPRKNFSKVNSEELKKDIVYWTDLVERNPTYQPGYIELGRLYIKIGYFEDARKVLEIASSLNPNSIYLKNTLNELSEH